MGRALVSAHYPVKPLSQQGLFISSIKPKVPKTTSNTWHHPPHSQPILSRIPRQNKPHIFPPKAKPHLTILHSYRYIYSLNAATKYIAPYRHHGCHCMVSQCNARGAWVMLQTWLITPKRPYFLMQVMPAISSFRITCK